MGDFLSKLLDSNEGRTDRLVETNGRKKEKNKESKLKVRKSVSESKSKSTTSIKNNWSPKSLSNRQSESRQSFYLPSNESMTLLDYDAEIVGPVKLTLDRKRGKSSVLITPSPEASSESVSETYAMTMAKFVPQYQQPIKKRGKRWFRRSKPRVHYSSDSSDSDESVRPFYESIYTRTPTNQRTLSGKHGNRPAELPPIYKLADSLKDVLNHGLEVIKVASHSDSDTGFGVRNIIDSKLIDTNATTSFTTELKTIKTDGKGHYSFNN